jgi:hypothetical protein
MSVEDQQALEELVQRIGGLRDRAGVLGDYL